MDIHYGRKRSGIVRELTEKIEDWLESIDDIDIQGIARKNVIVTGGSIASMLLGEKVNDFDVYFRDIETTKRVAEYYVKKFNNTQKSKSVAAGGVKYEPEVRIEERVNCKNVNETRVVLYMKSAGVAAEKQGAYNYFESMPEDAAVKFAKSTMEDMKEDGKKPKYRPVFISENAITLSHKVQLVTRFYGEPDKIHDNYDFIHATCYWDHANEELNLPADAMEALLSRTLVYKGSLYPVASVFRTKKFLQRGWRISAGQQLKMMWQISELDLKDYAVLREQLTGVDMVYMWQLVQALKDINPEKINSAYVSIIIDRIFDE